MQRWMGRVRDVLPHGLRVQKLDATGEFYIIPTSQIPMSLLRGLGLPNCHEAIVQFQAAQQPSSNEAAGEARAKLVRIIPAGQEEHEGHVGHVPQFANFPPPLPPCPAMMLAADAWQKQINQVTHVDCLKDLKDAANCAKGYGNGSLLCDIFCSCVAGVQVILDCLAWSEQFDKLPSLVDATFAVDAEPKLVQLLDTCLICLLAIDIRKTHVQKSIKLALLFCRKISPLLQGSRKMKELWQRMLHLVDAGLNRARAPSPKSPKGSKATPQMCSVPGCFRKCRRWILKNDAHGDIGWRCKMHSAKPMCNAAIELAHGCEKEMSLEKLVVILDLVPAANNTQIPSGNGAGKEHQVHQALYAGQTSLA
eukprot:s314_g34.t1